MKNSIIRDIAWLGLAAACLAPVVTTAGELEPPAAPTAPASAMYSTDAIWNRLNAGTGGEKRNGAAAFVEPAAGPDPNGGAGKTLDEIMAVAPAADVVNGATPADVASGKTYWSLRPDSTWGLQMSPWAPVPKSGQTTCYDAGGGPIDCAGTGQDGDLHKGVALPNPRFTDNSNGTVTDSLTGLIWLQNANCLDVSPKTWTEALTAIASLKGDGTMCDLADGSVAGDWRLPNIRELLSLENDQYFEPTLSNTAGTAQWTAGDPFLGVQSSYYWSSSSSQNMAWYVDFGDGYVENWGKNGSIFVWPVRGGHRCSCA